MSAPNPNAPQKNKMSPIAIVLIVVAGLVVAGGMVLVAAGWFVFNRVQEAAGGSEVWEQNPAFAAARLALSMNPDVEMIDSNVNNGTITVRNRETGEQVTMNLDDIQNGNFSWSASDGQSGSISASPNGITATSEGSSSSGTLQLGGEEAADPPEGVPPCDDCSFRAVASSTRVNARSGVLSFTSSRPPAALVQDYSRRLESEGYDDINTMNSSAAQFVTGRRGDSTITLNAVPSDGGSSSGNLTYNIEE